MKEITMITTCEITSIEVMTDDEVRLLEAFDEREIANIVKDDTGADDVQILKNQLFIRDLPDQN